MSALWAVVVVLVACGDSSRSEPTPRSPGVMGPTPPPQVEPPPAPPTPAAPPVAIPTTLAGRLVFAMREVTIDPPQMLGAEDGIELPIGSATVIEDYRTFHMGDIGGRIVAIETARKSADLAEPALRFALDLEPGQGQLARRDHGQVRIVELRDYDNQNPYQGIARWLVGSLDPESTLVQLNIQVDTGRPDRATVDALVTAITEGITRVEPASFSGGEIGFRGLTLDVPAGTAAVVRVDEDQVSIEIRSPTPLGEEGASVWLAEMYSEESIAETYGEVETTSERLDVGGRRVAFSRIRDNGRLVYRVPLDNRVVDITLLGARTPAAAPLRAMLAQLRWPQ